MTLYMRTGGSDTQKAQHAHGLTSVLAIPWTAFMFEYDFSDDSYQMRVIELGMTGTNQEDSGWMGGTVASPTFNAAVEQIRFIAGVDADFANDGGIAQVVVDDGTHAYNLGAARTANYDHP